MTPEELSRNIDRVADGLAPMLAQFMDTARLRLATTATSEYMKDAGFTSPPFPPRRSRSGPLRILSSRLARSLTNARFAGTGSPEGVAQLDVTKEGARMTYGTNVPYAHVHEDGFSGVVRIPAHTRTITQAFGKSIPSRTVDVREHRRSMFIPARPYLGPSMDDNEEQLQKILSARFQLLVLEAIDGK